MRAEEEERKEQEILYEFVNVNKGLSIYEIAKSLRWDVIETYNILKGLEKEGLIHIKASEKDEDELNKRVYPVEWIKLLPEDVKKALTSGKTR